MESPRLLRDRDELPVFELASGWGDLGVASQEDGDAAGGDDGSPCRIEKSGVDAVDEGALRMCPGRSAGMDGHGERRPGPVHNRGRRAWNLQARALNGGGHDAD